MRLRHLHVERALRREQAKRAAAKSFYGSRRARRPVIFQVPTVEALEGSKKTGSMRPVVVPYKPEPITWKEARRQGVAYTRVLDQLPKYHKEFEEKLREENIKQAERLKDAKAKGVKKPERYRRDPRGSWWMEKLADVIDRRTVITKPAYSPRARKPKKDPQPAVTE